MAVDPNPGSGPAASPTAGRGTTRVTPRAARRLVEGIVAHRCPGMVEPEVDVHLNQRDVLQGELRIAISFALAYPDGPLVDHLAAVRQVVAAEAGRCLGRSADRIDLLVTRLVTDEPRA